ncbi:glycoside hydrolase family 3 C-terminal domain-containing protein [Micromonospora sp. NPDC047740]|uniref:glycoside hydrolase family 3 protein n=1 Tax=Micromonospora sp. NPDC047740 TaxID=3364254 RepID=UPI00371DE1C4
MPHRRAPAPATAAITRRTPNSTRRTCGPSTFERPYATLRNAGVPVIVVLVSGRPLDVAGELPNWTALLASWLPGTEGAGIADVLFGGYAPTGKLPMTWMNSVGQQPINAGDGQVPLFPQGFGLTY